MADELTISCAMAYAKGAIDADLAFNLITVDVTGTDLFYNTQTIGFAGEEALELGNITTPGYFIAKNTDATNYLEIRQGTGIADLVRLNAGEACMFRFAADATAPFAIADTGDCDLEYLLIED